ncbi:MAG: acyltransferase [Campylobacterales bacterium]|nr:acyltransferase [Campylobacterales bacterium]
MKVINKIFRLLFQLYIFIFSIIPTEVGVHLRYYAYRPFFKSTKGRFRIGTGVTILGFKNIEIGDDVHIQMNSYLFAINAQIKLGYKFFLGTNSQLDAVREDIIIGDYCMIASNCVLVSDNHNFDNIKIPIMDQGFDAGKIIIEDNVWIASNCVVLKGVTIKTGSVVAAGSVVNKDVEVNSVVGGVPAKLIKKR